MHFLFNKLKKCSLKECKGSISRSGGIRSKGPGAGKELGDQYTQNRMPTRNRVDQDKMKGRNRQDPSGGPFRIWQGV